VALEQRLQCELRSFRPFTVQETDRRLQTHALDRTSDIMHNSGVPFLPSSPHPARWIGCRQNTHRPFVY
jgi:hypothetical protein